MVVVEAADGKRNATGIHRKSSSRPFPTFIALIIILLVFCFFHQINILASLRIHMPAQVSTQTSSVQQKSSSKLSAQQPIKQVHSNSNNGARDSKGYPITTRKVPRNVNRFDYPWRIPARVHLPTPKQSHNRILYSPIRDNSGDGLGHSMATINADLTTALRFNLTYTHRIASYGSLSFHSTSPNATFQHAGAVEQLFGWGAGEIPRERIQFSICPNKSTAHGPNKCRECNNSHLIERRRELTLQEYVRTNSRVNWQLRVDQIVPLPIQLSYRFPHYNTLDQSDEIEAFAKLHNKPFTVFTMPASYCMNSPAYSKFRPVSQAFFFHKYWDAHATRPDGKLSARIGRDVPVMYEEPFEDYQSRVSHGPVIGSSAPRSTLTRMNQGHINIAIHARRGDFFVALRPMVATRTFAKVVRLLMAQVINKQSDKFSSMPVSVSIYSEGRSIKGGAPKGHDVNRMTREYIDHDGSTQNEQEVERIFRDKKLDNFGDVFANGLEVSLRVSENTILCIHEMIAADVFIGSRSGLSINVVGSISRAAFSLLPWRDIESEKTQIPFEGENGSVLDENLASMKNMWRTFVDAHT